MDYYDQEAVLAYRVAEEVVLKNRPKPESKRKRTCYTCNGDRKIMSATGDSKHPLKAINCPDCQTSKSA